MSPKDKPTKPVDIYVRVSQVRGRDVEAEGGTAEQQVTRARAQLTALGYEAGEVFTDLDSSGMKQSRVEFDKLIARIDAGESGGLIAKDLSRFGRHKRVEEMILGLEAKGAVVILIDDSLNTSTASGRLLLGFMARLNQYYAELAGETWKRSRVTAAKTGKHVGRTPCGYVREYIEVADPDAEDGKRLVSTGRLLVDGDLDDPSTPAGAVRAAFKARAEGKSWLDCAWIIGRATGKATDTMPGESTQFVAKALAGTSENPGGRVYLGEIWEDGVCIKKGAHPALTDERTWRKVQARRESKERTRTGNVAFLKGILRCGSCDKAMSRDWAGGFYRCGSKGTCEHRQTIEYGIADTFVAEQVIEHYLGAFAKGATPTDRTADLEALVRDAEEEIRAVAALDLRPSVKAVMLDEATAALEAAQAELADYTPDTAAPAKSVLTELRRTLQTDPEAGATEVKRLMKAAIGKVVISPGRGAERISIVWADGTVTPDPSAAANLGKEAA